jgi:hypothetical protein
MSKRRALGSFRVPKRRDAGEGIEPAALFAVEMLESRLLLSGGSADILGAASEPSLVISPPAGIFLDGDAPPVPIYQDQGSVNITAVPTNVTAISYSDAASSVAPIPIIQDAGSVTLPAVPSSVIATPFGSSSPSSSDLTPAAIVSHYSAGSAAVNGNSVDGTGITIAVR